MKIGWRFPPVNGGKERGVNDTGIKYFTHNRWRFLAREIVQNSLDARRDMDSPIRITFDKITLDIGSFPDIETYKDILIKCKNTWKNSDTDKVVDRALEAMNKQHMDLIRISDYNTVGLAGPMKDRDSNLFKLIKAAGVSNKSKGSAGSYGIGKHAPFACSNVRSIFYGSIDETNTKVFQGVSILASYQYSDADATQDTGYYGVSENLYPIYEESYFPDFFNRTEIGTDIFIPFPKYDDNWELRMIKTIIDEFLVALLNDVIVVEIQNTIIDSKTIHGLIKKYYSADDDSYTLHYYNSIVNNEREPFVLEDVCKMGGIKLHLIEGRNLPKRVGYYRNGMKIFDYGRFRTSLYYSGVVEIIGNDLSEFLKQLEPPSHNSWESDLYEDDVKLAQKVLTTMHEWIRSKLREVNKIDMTESLDLENVGKYLPDEFNDEIFEEAVRTKEGEYSTTPVVNDKSAHTLTSIQSFDQSTGKKADINDAENGDSDPLVDGDEPDGSFGGAGGNDGPNGGNAWGHGPGDGNGTGSTGNRSGGSEDEESNTHGSASGHNEDVPSIKKRKIINLKHRMICSDPSTSEYTLLFTPIPDKEIYFDIKIKGETGKDPVEIISAFDKSSNVNVAINGTTIGPLTFIDSSSKLVTVQLNKNYKLSLEVASYELQK